MENFDPPRGWIRPEQCFIRMTGKRTHTPLVYFVELCGFDLMKIGTTKNFKERITGLRSQFPKVRGMMLPWCFLPGSYEVEYQIHRQFEDIQYDEGLELFHMKPALFSGMRRLAERMGGYARIDGPDRDWLIV